MSDPIKNLAAQAHQATLAVYRKRMETEFAGDVIFSDMYDQKFGELIIAECINIIKPTSHHEAWAQSYLGGVDGLELLDGKIVDIKKHFGVNI